MVKFPDDMIVSGFVIPKSDPDIGGFFEDSLQVGTVNLDTIISPESQVRSYECQRLTSPFTCIDHVGNCVECTMSHFCLPIFTNMRARECTKDGPVMDCSWMREEIFRVFFAEPFDVLGCILKHCHHKWELLLSLCALPILMLRDDFLNKGKQ